MEYKIESVEVIDSKNPENRKVKVRLNNGTIVFIESCLESWQQYGGTNDELYATQPVAEYYDDWLHGGDEPEPFLYENDYDLTRDEVVEFINENGINLFGDKTEEVAEAIADEVLNEYNEAGDEDLQKALAYVIMDKFGALV